MYDVVVIGSGAAGTSVTQVLGRARRNVLLLSGEDTRNTPAAEVHGVITRDGTSPAEFNRAALQELRQYPAVTMKQATAKSIDGAKGDFIIETDDGVVGAHRVVLATGVVDELPAIDGLVERWGRSVLHCPYCHGWEVREQPLALLALSLVDVYVAIHLTQWSSDVLLCLNGIAVSEDQLALLNASGVQVQQGKVTRLDGEVPHLDRLVFDDGSTVERYALFVHPPTRQRSDLPAALGCRVLDDGAVEVDELGQTSVPGVYAVGDMARRTTQEPGLTFVTQAMADGHIAGLAVNRELFFEALFTA